MVKVTQELPPSRSAGWSAAKYLGNGHLATNSVERNGLTFLRIPTVASRKPVETWSIPPFAFGIFGYAVYPPENILAVAERGER